MCYFYPLNSTRSREVSKEKAKLGSGYWLMVYCFRFIHSNLFLFWKDILMIFNHLLFIVQSILYLQAPISISYFQLKNFFEASIKMNSPLWVTFDILRHFFLIVLMKIWTVFYSFIFLSFIVRNVHIFAPFFW